MPHFRYKIEPGEELMEDSVIVVGRAIHSDGRTVVIMQAADKKIMINESLIWSHGFRVKKLKNGINKQ